MQSVLALCELRFVLQPLRVSSTYKAPARPAAMKTNRKVTSNAPPTGDSEKKKRKKVRKGTYSYIYKVLLSSSTL